MPRLVAQFDVALPFALQVRGEGAGDLRGDWQLPSGSAKHLCQVAGFSCELEFVQDPSGPVQLSPGKGALFGVDEVRVRVSGEESEAPPPIERDEQGNRDHRGRTAYFKARRSAYIGAAKTTIDRLILFARYRLGVPGARGVTAASPRAFDNPQWFYDDDGPLEPGSQYVTLSLRDHSSPGTWQVAALEPTGAGSISSALSTLPAVPLHREMQALGKDAAVAGDLRRAVIELAVACEVAVKQAFFAPNSAASEAFEFLEEKRKVEVSVVELLGQPAARAFGATFAQVHPEASTAIEELFRCRNKVAHRGRLEYRDAKSRLREADQPAVRLWWEASEVLLNWLERSCGLAGIIGL